MGAVISLHHSSKVLCRRDVNSGSWRVRSLMAPPLFWSLILPEMTTSKMARITMLVNKLTIQCEWHSSKSLGSTLTSGTFKYTHTALHDSYFESLGNLEMYLNLTSWQSIDIWTHSWCLCLSFLKHNFFFFFSPELTYSGWTFFSQYSPIKMATLWLSVTPIGAWPSAAMSDWCLTHFAPLNHAAGTSEITNQSFICLTAISCD